MYVVFLQARNTLVFNKIKLGVPTEALQQEFMQGLDTYSPEDQKILSDQFTSQIKVRKSK